MNEKTNFFLFLKSVDFSDKMMIRNSCSVYFKMTLSETFLSSCFESIQMQTQRMIAKQWKTLQIREIQSFFKSISEKSHHPRIFMNKKKIFRWKKNNKKKSFKNENASNFTSRQCGEGLRWQ